MSTCSNSLNSSSSSTSKSSKAYFSITKFTDFLKQHYNYSCDCLAFVYFKVDDCFINKFNHVCIKPVLLKIQKPNYIYEYIKHDCIIKTFGCQPIVSYTVNKSRPSLKAIKSNIAYLSVNFDKQEYKGLWYYPTRVNQSVNVETNDKIIKQIIMTDETKHSKTLLDDGQLPDDF